MLGYFFELAELLSILFFSFDPFNRFARCSTEAQLDRVGGRKWRDGGGA